MPLTHGAQYEPNDTLSAQDANDLMAAANRIQSVRGGSENVASVTDGGIIIEQNPLSAWADQAADITRQTFVGQIASNGPMRSSGAPLQDDFIDARYWVREVRENTPRDDGVAYAERPILVSRPEELGEIFTPQTLRWIPAVNLAELNLVDPLAEAHALGIMEDDDPDSGALVHVFWLLGPFGAPKYFFSSPIGGAGIKYAVIVDRIDDPLSRLLMVHEVRPRFIEDKPWDGRYAFHGPGDSPDHPLPIVSCRPTMVAEDYDRWRWLPDQLPTESMLVPEEATPIELHWVNAIWIAQQDPKWTSPAVRTNVNHTDCELVVEQQP